jgi:hypothetical protein
MGLRLMTGQSQRRGDVKIRPQIIIRFDRDRPAGPFDRLIVLLQPEIGRRSQAIPILQIRIVRAQPNRLVRKFAVPASSSPISLE